MCTKTMDFSTNQEDLVDIYEYTTLQQQNAYSSQTFTEHVAM